MASLQHSLRELIGQLLNDNNPHTIHELVVLCDQLIPPEKASRAYITGTGCKTTQLFRRTRPLEQRIVLGRYVLIRNTLRTDIKKGLYLKSGSGNSSVYRKNYAQQ